jgi:hypothetical protein
LILLVDPMESGGQVSWDEQEDNQQEYEHEHAEQQNWKNMELLVEEEQPQPIGMRCTDFVRLISDKLQ